MLLSRPFRGDPLLLTVTSFWCSSDSCRTEKRWKTLRNGVTDVPGGETLVFNGRLDPTWGLPVLRLNRYGNGEKPKRLFQTLLSVRDRQAALAVLKSFPCLALCGDLVATVFDYAWQTVAEGGVAR
jgi:hypothetical protein